MVFLYHWLAFFISLICVFLLPIFAVKRGWGFLSSIINHHLQSFNFHPQIITDIIFYWIITDFIPHSSFLIPNYWRARKSTAFSKSRLLAPHYIFHGTSWLRLACASSRLSFPLSFLSTDYHRLSQIFLISKDFLIITDYNHQ